MKRNILAFCTLSLFACNQSTSTNKVETIGDSLVATPVVYYEVPGSCSTTDSNGVETITKSTVVLVQAKSEKDALQRASKWFNTNGLGCDVGPATKSKIGVVLPNGK
jgi:hypothetical protein